MKPAWAAVRPGDSPGRYLTCLLGNIGNPKASVLSDIRIRGCIVLLSAGQFLAFGQEFEHLLGQFDPLSAGPGGWRVASASASTAYYSVGLPSGYGGLPAGEPLKPAWSRGGGGSIEWTATRGRSTAALAYTAFYQSQSGYTGFRNLNQSLSVTWDRKLADRWSFGLSANAAAMNREQYLYAPLAESAIALVPRDRPIATLPAGAGGMQLPPPGLGNANVGPLGDVLFGNRLFTSQLTAALRYQQSERTSWTFFLSGTRLQGLPDKNGSGGQPAGMLAASTAVSAGVRARYLLSPRTTLNFEAAETKTVARTEDAWAVRATTGISRVMSPHWLAEVHAGGSQISPLRQVYALPAGFGYIAGGSTSFQTFGHTLEASINRQAGDAYGLGAANSLTAKGSWWWKRPGNVWSLHAVFSWLRLDEGSSVEDWQVTGAATRELSAHVALEIAYVYLQFSGRQPAVSAASILPTQSSLRATLNWYPEAAH